MATTVLGKRARSSKDHADLELSAKRTRPSARVQIFHDDHEHSCGATPTRPEVIETEENDENAIETYPASVTKTPSKRRSQSLASSQFAPVTPQTPRHRDVFARAPSTPRHQVMSAGKLFKRLTPQTPLTPTSAQTVYHQARQLFSRSADPGQLIGRDDERAQLESFLSRCGTPKPSGCLYVSGPPGTGKSAMINEVTESLAKQSSVRKAYVNCMSIKSSKDLYTTLMDLLCSETELSESDAQSQLQKMFVPRKKSADVFLVVLDEVDHVLSLDLESMYRLFEWSMQKSSRLALVGIANALDLTDRFLPRLKARNLKPELLPFMPYTAIQIKNIITTRLQSLLPAGCKTPNFVPFIHPVAIELCSRKVSSQTGDLRKAFEICRRAVDLIEIETRQQLEIEVKERILQQTPSRKPLGENASMNSPSRGAREKDAPSALAEELQKLTAETAPRASIGCVNKVTAAAFSNGSNQRLKTLNLQQKAALCALMALEKRNKEAKAAAGPATPSKYHVTAPTIKTLYDTYTVLCTRDSVLHPLSGSEFREVIYSLESLSLATPVDGKTGSLVVASTPKKRRGKTPFGGGSAIGDEKRVASCVGDKEIEQAIDGLGADILRSILNGEALN